jgi:hypothetical protein
MIVLILIIIWIKWSVICYYERYNEYYNEQVEDFQYEYLVTFYNEPEFSLINPFPLWEFLQSLWEVISMLIQIFI